MKNLRYMKQHTVIGVEILEDMVQYYQDEPLVKTAREICRWHHERYDGRGISGWTERGRYSDQRLRWYPWQMCMTHW